MAVICSIFLAVDNKTKPKDEDAGEWTLISGSNRRQREMAEKLKGWIYYAPDKKLQVSQVTVIRPNPEGNGAMIHLPGGEHLISEHNMSEVIQRIRETMREE